MQLAEIPDELMMYIVKSCAVDEALLVFISNLKQTSRQMRNYMHREMAKNVAYRELVKELLLVVPGTRIACGATHMPEPPLLTGIAQLLHKFNSEMLTADNGVGIGGTYISDGGFLQNSVVQDTDDNTYLVAVNIYFQTATYLTGLPSIDDHLTDLSRVPNVVRSVLGMTGLTGSVAHANYCVEWDLVGKYTRMVRVNSKHTMQNIQDAIAWREGLVFDGFVLHMHTRDVEAVLTAQTSVPEFLQIRHDSTISTCLHVWWDGQLRPYPDSSDDENSEDEDDDDDLTGTVVPAALQVPTPSVIPVDYPSDDIQITSEETLDDSDAVASEQINTFYI
jgi:hypothetical protein